MVSRSVIQSWFLVATTFVGIAEVSRSSRLVADAGTIAVADAGDVQSGASGQSQQSGPGEKSAKSSHRAELHAGSEPPKIPKRVTELIEQTNVVRRKQGLSPLEPDRLLIVMAQSHSETMARMNEIGHDVGGDSFSARLKKSGVESLRAGENVAAGQRSASEVISDWMKSPGHRANILDRDFRRIGVGVAVSRSGTRYYTQVFATPVPPSAALKKKTGP